MKNISRVEKFYNLKKIYLLMMIVFVVSGCQGENSEDEKALREEQYNVLTTYEMPLESSFGLEQTSATYYNTDKIDDEDQFSTNYNNILFLNNGGYVNSYSEIKIQDDKLNTYKNDYQFEPGYSILDTQYYDELGKVVTVYSGGNNVIEVFDTKTQSIVSKAIDEKYWAWSYYLDGDVVRGFDSESCNQIEYNLASDTVEYFDNNNLCQAVAESNSTVLQVSSEHIITFDYDQLKYYNSDGTKVTKEIDVPDLTFDQKGYNTIISYRVYGGNNLVYISDQLEVVNVDLGSGTVEVNKIGIDSEASKLDVYFNQNENKYYLLSHDLFTESETESTCTLYDETEQISTVDCTKDDLVLSGFAVERNQEQV